MNVVKGGPTVCGNTIGVILLNCVLPRMPGDIGNSSTFNFPVAYTMVMEGTQDRVVGYGSMPGSDKSLLRPFIDAAKYLEAQGVKAITTSCGFLALFQREMSQAVKIPVFASSLIQVPFVAEMIGREKRVGILTANGATLTEEHFNNVGWSTKDYKVAIQGMHKYPHYAAPMLRNQPYLNFPMVESEMITAARNLVTEYPDIGAFVFECANMPPYVKAVQDALGLPVYDIVTLTNFVYDAVQPRTYERPGGERMVRFACVTDV